MFFVLQRVGSGNYYKTTGAAGNHELTTDLQAAKLFKALIYHGELVTDPALPDGTDDDYVAKSVQVHLT